MGPWFKLLTPVGALAFVVALLLLSAQSPLYA
jgi:hypothetical protein